MTTLQPRDCVPVVLALAATTYLGCSDHRRNQEVAAATTNLPLPAGMLDRGGSSHPALSVSAGMGVQVWVDAYLPDSAAPGRVHLDRVELVLHGASGDRLVTLDDFDTRWTGDKGWGEWLDASATGWGRTQAKADDQLPLGGGWLVLDPGLAPMIVARPCYAEAWDRFWPRSALGPATPGDLLIARARVRVEGQATARVGLDLWNAPDRSDSHVEACYSAPIGATSGQVWLETQVRVASTF